MPFNSYSQINSLEETTFIAGNDFTLEYAVYEEDGVTPMDLGGANTYCLLSPYGFSGFNKWIFSWLSSNPRLPSPYVAALEA